MEKIYKNGVKYGVVVGMTMLVAVTVAFGFSIPGFGKFEKVKPVNNVVTIPVAKVSDGSAHYYRLEASGKEISFFVVKGSDGAIHTAFDACDVCYHEKKGYEQQGDQMICKNCNKKFAITRIGADTAGGCNPSHLSSKVEGGNVQIKLADLLPGARFF
jgi:uncharacterized membrane protein